MPCESICHFTIHNEISRVKASISQDVINERAKHSKPEFNPVERREFFNFLSGNIEFVRIPDKCRRIVCSQFPNILIFVWENNEKILILVDELVLKLIDGDGKLKVELYHRFDINTFSKWLEEIETGILKVSYFNDKRASDTEDIQTDLNDNRTSISSFTSYVQTSLTNSIGECLSYDKIDPPITCSTIINPERIFYPPIDAEMEERISRWLNVRGSDREIITKFRITIRRISIETLNPKVWLDDEVINFYMELLSERSRSNKKLPRVHAMNTNFLEVLLGKHHEGEFDYKKVKKWTKKVYIFLFDVVLVPVFLAFRSKPEEGHWCMAIIHMKNKTIKYYDSFGNPNNHILNALANYLKEESRKRKIEFNISDWKLENVKNIPQQENGYDCGVFSCQYAEVICRNQPILFTQQDITYFRKKMIYEICTGKMLS